MSALRYFPTVLLAFITANLLAQSPSKVTVEDRELLTYPYDDPNPVPFHGKTSKIYPYTEFEGYSKIGKKQKWKVVKLENDFIEVYVLPEVGGKIWVLSKNLQARNSSIVMKSSSSGTSPCADHGHPAVSNSTSVSSATIRQQQVRLITGL
ncbi:MAG: DUF5107 domain-containing protein [Bacteroidota bacterium]